MTPIQHAIHVFQNHQKVFCKEIFLWRNEIKSDTAYEQYHITACTQVLITLHFSNKQFSYELLQLAQSITHWKYRQQFILELPDFIFVQKMQVFCSKIKTFCQQDCNVLQIIPIPMRSIEFFFQVFYLSRFSPSPAPLEMTWLPLHCCIHICHSHLRKYLEL